MISVLYEQRYCTNDEGAGSAGNRYRVRNDLKQKITTPPPQINLAPHLRLSSTYVNIPPHPATLRTPCSHRNTSDLEAADRVVPGTRRERLHNLPLQINLVPCLHLASSTFRLIPPRRTLHIPITTPVTPTCTGPAVWGGKHLACAVLHCFCPSSCFTFSPSPAVQLQNTWV